MNYLYTKYESDVKFGVYVTSNDKHIGDYILDIDGYFYYDPTEERGSYSDYTLIELGEKLKEINKPYNDLINESLR